MRQLIVLCLLCLLVATPLYAQDEGPYEVALQRIAEAAETNAVELDFEYLGLTELPPEIGQLHNLERLYINFGNSLTSLPPEIGQLSRLTELWLWGNNLAIIPPEIGNLENLEVLVLDNNQLTELPPEIGRLHRLRGLSASVNQLDDLPPEIGQLSNLEFLMLSYNNFQQLPPEIGQLSSLRILIIEVNQLSTLPDEIASLTNLESLILGNNQFRYLSDVFLELEIANTEGQTAIFSYTRNGWGSTPGVSLRNNPLISPPSHIADQGLPAIQLYLREQRRAHIEQVLLWIALGVSLFIIFVLAFRLKAHTQRKPKKKREMVGD